jgi:gluconate 2-dehydrogenase gamma chain
MDELGSRRGFLLALGGVWLSASLSASLSEIAAAAEHAAAQGALEFFHPDEAADVEAITAQILPSGAKPGAREARAAHFIDHALATFFASRAPAFRLGLADFQSRFRTAHPSLTSFAAAPPSEQIVYLTSVEHTEFFEALRVLTIVGTLSSPVYGGNYDGAGWKMLGFEEQHVFSPPFGYYDRGYTYEKV